MPLCIAVLGALEKEVAHLFETLPGAERIACAGLNVAIGTYRQASLVATVAGMGTVNAAAAAQHLISQYQPQYLIFSGIAGGLNPALHIDDIVIGEQLRYTDTDTPLLAESHPHLEEFSSTPALVDIAETLLLKRGYIHVESQGLTVSQTTNAPLQVDTPFQANISFQTDTPPHKETSPGASTQEPQKRYCRGVIATGNRFVSGAKMREKVIAATHADCAEMEGAAIAHVAAKNNVDCLVLRAISDNCDEEYDALSSRQFDLARYARTASELILELIDCIIEQASGHSVEQDAQLSSQHLSEKFGDGSAACPTK
ncbi:5'-methylthioadenosine/S-adenosylhomocysteine nucleosidase [Collinsella sp. zg1085]|uniref:5'-methylthioadenosine/S-adenosylhomocysteine nucleosidase n=1 Tax=Collinsella sp. zg1085 TaxID=2844380 RepID=UPI001C0C198D|nr:5'-methylthioadenosine/S-adenosylhomocysteine nucleosidase [Collinsella sp. zg1085]QWT17830.1 5'-methylthioadenosine/S-adenosylhomocysteine nucleosidase [Collinsella sp. zg1085]